MASFTPEKYWGCVAKDEVLVRPLQSMLQEYIGTAPINLRVYIPRLRDACHAGTLSVEVAVTISRKTTVALRAENGPRGL